MITIVVYALPVMKVETHLIIMNTKANANVMKETLSYCDLRADLGIIINKHILIIHYQAKVYSHFHHTNTFHHRDKTNTFPC